ncbi:MAG: sulfotransferase, partial [Gammaproteobacteria bacterium]|nr:sulfotransferase [Gammaproteobacteria bacterium]
VKVTDYLDEISNLCDLTNKPFLAKGLMHQFNLEFMHKKMPNTIFLYIKRNVKAVMQSIYMARLSEFGDTRKWWSAKPKEYAELVNKSPEEQIAGQVYYINKAISQGMEKIPTGKKLTVHYEDFIKRPDVIYVSLSVLYKKLGVNIDTLNSYPEMGMYNSDNVLIDECVADRLSKYYLEFRNK